MLQRREVTLNDAVALSGLVVAVIGVLIAAIGVFGWRCWRGRHIVQRYIQLLNEVLINLAEQY